MAIVLNFDKKQFNSSGLLPLKRGDDWALEGKVLEKYASYSRELDLTGMTGATAFFEADSDAALPGNLFAAPVVVTDAKGGGVEIDIPASGTPSLATAPDGVGAYLTLNLPGRGLITVPLERPVLAIDDRRFDEP